MVAYTVVNWNANSDYVHPINVHTIIVTVTTIVYKRPYNNSNSKHIVNNDRYSIQYSPPSDVIQELGQGKEG
jgi:hypothetical protein